jgi:hypothetical protein
MKLPSQSPRRPFTGARRILVAMAQSIEGREL